ncbi:MAG: M48 family metallopeptidase [Gammaproteobacteria bacterium]|uniref:M48 family metallopeptidase n=1 Tax=Rhodoferax sp. TaxID=50421 RepID=UPI001817CAD3|nr:SprT family zinc-dependent metalloprotease [Rhodoferax sp.]MBU3899257.1 M48 family metallopeptidase [Gammaproteobacteria bacterium]MBA3058851.1 M48 family metallopeptidase [Rhodoferax sp.]MBU3996941.1 M48 family metallopeptidase [Gammaproteobacteria bacterium]MBU4081233.1 M48 family metallopeptidase [Gammaproteobacteria bacterium]MBU4115467.1 M48 family metallopeptidase [Gammaproteobacteria bacterium]
MHPLLRFTLDIFEPNRAPALVNHSQSAPEIIVAKTLPVSPPALPTTPVVAGPTNSMRHPRANREARLGDVMVAYELKRGQRRSIGFVIRAEGLVVSAPKWVPLHQVDAALQDKSRWIVQKLSESQARQQRLQGRAIEWCDGAMIPYLGQPLQLLLVPPADAGGKLVRFKTGGLGTAELTEADAPSPTLRLALPAGASEDQIRDAAQAWLKRQAQLLFKARLDHFAPQLQVQWRSLALSSARTRWGSARIDGSIRLNWRLMHFQSAVIDYVVVHELSHLRVMDHSPRFWAVVHAVIPDHLALRRQLKDATLPHGL